MPLFERCKPFEKFSRTMDGTCCDVHAVTLTIKNYSTKYTVLQTFREVRDFAIDLKDAKEDGIVVDGSHSPLKTEEAVRAIYNNVIVTGPLDSGTPFLALILWQIHKWLFPYSINSVIYCLNELHKIAPTAFEKARLLLLSQCNPDFIPLETADWSVIEDAVRMLKSEKNGETESARDLLRVLECTGRYERRRFLQDFGMKLGGEKNCEEDFE
jgi:hypothetical protein